MKDMSLTADEAKEYNNICCTSEGDGPKYPWGLTLNLENATLKKLGMDDLPQVGTKMNMMAVVEVVSVGQRQERDGDRRTELALQITSMELQRPQGDADLAAKMWPSK